MVRPPSSSPSSPPSSPQTVAQRLASPLRCGCQFIRSGHIPRDFTVNNFAVVWLVRGALEVEIDGKVYAVQPGDAFHRWPDRKHTMRCLEPSETRFCALPSATYAVLHDLGCPGVHDLVIHPGPHADLLERWDALIEETGNQSPLRLAQTATRCQELVVDLHLRAVTQQHPAAARVEAACRMLAQDHPPAVAVVAARVGLSAASLRRQFATVLGISPWAWHLHWRIDRARERLLSDVRPIAGVAATLGWRDAGTFNRTFRDIVGVSPGMWRKRNS